jgi:hypothetical protein
MNLTRRSLLAVPAAFAVPHAGSPSLEPLAQGHVILRGVATAEGLILPATRARILARLTLSGHTVAAIAFGATATDSATDLAGIDLVALAALDSSAAPRLLALEFLTYASAANGDPASVRLDTRLAATSDGARIRLARSAAFTRSPTLVERSAWIDYFAWNDGGPLADAPIHPAPAGSLAAELATRRARVRIALAAPVAEITPALLADTRLLRPLMPSAPASPLPPGTSPPPAGSRR